MHRDSSDNEAYEALLTRAKPTPPDEVVDRIERRLMGKRPGAASRQARWRPLLTAGGATAAIAAAIFTVGLAGGGPLGQDTGVTARDTCRWVVETQKTKRPFLVRGTNGQLRVEYRTETVRRRVKRCD